MTSLPYGAVWLNDTIAFAGCYAAHASGKPQTNLEATTTVDQMSTGTGATATATATAEANGIAGKRDDMGMWVVAGTGLAAAAANTLL